MCVAFAIAPVAATDEGLILLRASVARQRHTSGRTDRALLLVTHPNSTEWLYICICMSATGSGTPAAIMSSLDNA